MAITRTAAAKDVRAKPDIDIAVLPFVTSSAGLSTASAGKEAGPAGIDRRELLVATIDGAEHAPLPVAGEAVHNPLQDARSGPALRQIEAGGQDPGARQRAGDGSRQRVTRAERDE